MKKVIIVLALCCCGRLSEAQDVLLQQIAALQGYIGDAEKGYQIVEDGLHTIRDVKNGEFGLHSVFFGSLRSVNPKVGQMAEVGEIIGLQIALVSQVSSALSTTAQNKWLEPGERSFILKMYTVILDDCRKSVTALEVLTTDGQLTMTDGDRIQAIQEIDNEIRDEYGIMRGFRDRAELLAAQRARESAGDGGIGKLYGF